MERVHGERRNVDNAEAFAKKDTIRNEKYAHRVAKARQRAPAVAPVLQLPINGAETAPADVELPMEPAEDYADIDR